MTGEITLYVADDDGPLVTGDVTIVEEAVQLYTEWLGLTVAVENSTLVTVTYSGTLTIYSRGATANDAEILAQIDAELLAAGQIADRRRPDARLREKRDLERGRLARRQQRSG